MINPDVDLIHAQLVTTLSKRYSMVEREDISQELWAAYFATEWGLQGPEKPVDGLEDQGLYEEYSKTLQAVRKEMRSGAEKYCRTEKAALEGYELSDEIFYGIKSLRALVEAWFAHGPVEEPPRTAETSVSRTKGTGAYGDYLVSLIDVSVGLNQLKHHHKMVLFYGFSPAYAGRTDEEIAMELRSRGWKDMSPQTFNRKIGRALTRLKQELQR